MIGLRVVVMWRYGPFVGLWRCVLLGAAGGALVEVLAVLGYVLAWQRARRTPGGRVRKSPPGMRAYVDVPAHVWVLAIRVPLGAGTAWLFATTGQISGPYAALAFGFAAPAVLAQVGRWRGAEQIIQGDARGELPPSPTDLAFRVVADQSEEVEQP